MLTKKYGTNIIGDPIITLSSHDEHGYIDLIIGKNKVTLVINNGDSFHDGHDLMQTYLDKEMIYALIEELYRML